MTEPESPQTPVATNVEAAAFGPARRWILRLTTAAALIVSSYLAGHSLLNTGHGPIGCGDSGLLDCREVLSSRWGQWWGLPVPLPAVPFYLGLLFILVFIGPNIPPNVRRRATTWTCAAAMAAAMLAVWFLVLQIAVLQHVCLFCSLLHGLNLMLAGTALTARLPGARRVLTSLGLGIAVLALLIAGQVFVNEPKAYVLVTPQIEYDEEIFTLTTKDHQEFGRSSDARWTLQGIVGIDTREIPYRGDSPGGEMVVFLFDYTCQHCRQMHRQLQELQAQRQKPFTVFLVPVPLDPNCNVYVSRGSDESRDACALAELALAVWNAQPESFAAYDAWLMQDVDPPSAAAARAEAEKLLGQEGLVMALANEAIERQVRDNVALYDFLERGVLPKLLLRRSYILGKTGSVEELADVVAREQQL